MEEFRHPDQSPFIEITRHLEKDTTRPAEHIDKDALLRTWSALRDTHDFFPMLRDFEIGRTDALKLAEGSFSWKVKRETTQEMLLLASGRQIPIMVFCGQQRNDSDTLRSGTKKLRSWKTGSISWTLVLICIFAKT